MEDTDFVLAKLKTAVGSKLSTVGAINIGGVKYPTLIFLDDHGEQITVMLMSDAEGNGPGWAEVTR